MVKTTRCITVTETKKIAPLRTSKSRGTDLRPVDQGIKDTWDRVVTYRCSIFKPGEKLISLEFKPPLEKVLETAKSYVDSKTRTIMIYAVDSQNVGALIATIDSNGKVKKVVLKQKKKLTDSKK